MKQVIPLNQLFDGTESLSEDMTYAQLFNFTDSGRHARASKVRGPPLEIFAGDKKAYHIFNFKSFPSTTGFRHRGYIAFKKPRNGQPQPSESLAVEVDCDCEDYRYRWAWANKQKGAGKVGPNSLNKSINRAPVITNPAAKPSLCKHLVAAKNFIWGLIQRFPGAPEPGAEPEPVVDVSWKIAQLVKKAQDRYDNYGLRKQQAKQRMDVYRQGQIARNIQGPMPQADVPPGADNELPVALPQDQPPVEPVQAPEPTPETPTPKAPEGENKKRTESLVVRAKQKSMNTEALKKTKAIVEEMGDELQATMGDEGGSAAMDVPPPPAEGGEEGDLPPVTAGPDEPEDEALQLLRNISMGIDRLANELAPAEAPEGEMPGEDEKPPGEDDEEGKEETGVPPVEDDDDFSETMPVSTGA
jgi:hypothetical protein